MASKLVRYSHLRALSSSISINNHIRSPHFSNPNRAPLSFSYRLFSNAFSSSSTGGFQRASSLKDLELAKFASIAETCWDFEGPFKPLHVMNPTRLAFIRSTLCRHFDKDPNSARPFEGLKIVDAGCGGGILSEPLARMGATVTGVDAVEKNIKIAHIHADLDPVTSTIEYCCTTAEKLVEEDRKFDAVIALEVIEHVANPAEFCKSLAALTVPDGATIISTINRSMRSYATAIVAAEYLLHWLPKGTHEWSSFLTPEELVLILQRANITVREMAGFVYNPLTGRWSLSDDIRVPKTGLNTPFQGGLLKDVAESVIKWAKDGLERRGIGESMYLNELAEDVITGLTPAEKLLQMYNEKWGKKC